MTINDLKTQVSVFRSQVENYRRTFVNADYSLSSDSRERTLLIHRAGLTQAYGKYEKYINALSKNSDVYLSAFSNNVEILDDIDAVIQDLNYIHGKLESMGEEEFKSLFEPKSSGPKIEASGGHGGHGFNGSKGGDGGAGGSVSFVQVGKEFTPEGITIKDVKNPHRAYWRLVFGNAWRWIKKNKIISTVIIGLVIAYLVYLFGWNK